MKIAKAFKAKWGTLSPQLVELYAEPPQGVGRRVRLTIMTVDDVVGGLDDVDWLLLAVNVGHPQFSVASVLLYRHALADVARDWLDSLGIWATPIAQWEHIYKAYLTDVNRFNLVDSSRSLEWNVACANATRKIMTLTGRDLLPADYEKDFSNTLPGATFHMAPVPNSCRLSSAQWDLELMSVMRDLAKQVIRQVEEHAEPNRIEQWWVERWGWNPAGSSSLRDRLNKLKEEDDRLRSGCRPNKRTVAEALRLEEMLDILGGRPTGVARVSTKPEPGYKRRTLYAIDDYSHYIASYASADIEKYMNIGGMVAKQTPEDVVEWYLTDIYGHTNPNSVWLSLDYSDFNKDHDRRHLAMLNSALAEEWLQLAKRNPLWQLAARTKALCALHIGREHLNAWVRMPDGEYRRHYNGLWSGHRDTARDNTMLHYCYSTMVGRLNYRCMGMKPRSKYLGMCGDDEDGLHDTWAHAATYVGMHSLCGFSINYAKQRCSKKFHEFLQRFADGRELPFRPMANVIAAISTGSWYKQSIMRYDSTAQELSQNCTELISRGMTCKMARRLAYKMLDALYVARDLEHHNNPQHEQGKASRCRLDWWPVRYGGSGKAGTLWGRTDPDTPTNWEKPLLKLPQDAPMLASHDWLTSKWQWASALTNAQLGAYKAHLLRENYKSLYSDHLTAEGEMLNSSVLKPLSDEARRKRNALIADLPEYEPIKASMKLNINLTKALGARQPITKERLLAAFKVDTQLFELLGGWDGVLARCKPQQLAKYTYIPKDVPNSYAGIDTMEPALANKIKQRNLPIV
jgi:hypothetical protein